MRNKKSDYVFHFTREKWEEFVQRVEKAWENVDSGDGSLSEETLILHLNNNGEIQKGSHIKYEFNQYGEIDV